MARHTASREADRRAKAKYQHKHQQDYNNIYLRCHKEHDKDILEYLATKENKTAFIKGLIRAEMASGKS